ncbi:segregation/condensation protein A [Clostridium manihotivorum]|uniref:Segregation and condensation protein A n=1 Tax=Clostridium manihotivorum TaxID=2320868 RepID=A0A3R5TFH0_9CLOT|nr:segregation/condensation protein A [Clostridium manihotivorum]QAA32084.1 segregation/condensation protein A [Clostridium manihotivorum]
MQLPSIKITNFEGPFDLLLHLIKQNKMDIHDIKIYELTNQYMDFLNSMKEMDLEITSEFIVVAATLLEIKSRMLLPKPVKEDEEDKDPKLDLVEKLLIYKKIKNAAAFLGKKSLYTGKIFTKKPEIIEDLSKDNNEDIFLNITMLDLYNLFNELINNYKNKQNTNVIEKRIYADKYKLEDKMSYISDMVLKRRNIDFQNLLYECESKIEKVVTFLAVLELIKQRVIKVMQEDSFANIYIERNENIGQD